MDEIRTQLELPLSHKQIKNETELRAAFLDLIEESFGYSRHEFKEERCLKLHQGKIGFYDFVLELADRTDIAVLIEFKFQSEKHENAVNQAIGYLNSDIDPTPVFFSIVWKQGDKQLISHHNPDGSPLPLDIWDSYFPEKRELIWWNDTKSTTQEKPTRIVKNKQLLTIFRHLEDHNWESVYIILDSHFFYRTAHLDPAIVNPLISLLRIEYEDLPRQIAFYCYKLLGDHYDTRHSFVKSGVQYDLCLKNATSRRQLTLAYYLKGVNAWRLGNATDSLNYYLTALDLNEEQLTPNILSDLVLVELGRAIPKDIGARYAIGSVAYQQLARQHLSGIGQNRIEGYFRNIDEIDATHSGAQAAVVDVKALWFQIKEDY